MPTKELIETRLKQTEFSFGDMQKIADGSFLYADSPQLPGADAVNWRLFDRLYDVQKNEETGGVVCGEYSPKADHPILKDHFLDLKVFPGFYLVDHLLQMTGFLIGIHGVRGQGLARGCGACKFLKPATPDAGLITFGVEGTSFKKGSKMTTLVADGSWKVDGKLAGTAKDIRVVVIHSR